MSTCPLLKLNGWYLQILHTQSNQAPFRRTVYFSFHHLYSDEILFL
jgi:hypothetical protein